MAKVEPRQVPGSSLPRPAPRGKSVAASDAAAPQRYGTPAEMLPLIAEIDASGEELKRDPTGGALARYKSAVQRFLDTALAGSIGIASESSLGLANKIFATVTKVDLALAELTDNVLGRQPDILRAAALVDHVKGLVVDLYR